MLKVQVADLVKVLSVDAHGVCDDGTERSWCRCSVLSFFDKDETYMGLTCFGATADMVLENHTGSNMRRAFISGQMEIKPSKIKQKIKVKGEKLTIMVPSFNFSIIADSVKFIDKNNTAVENEEDDDDGDVIEYEALEYQETAATSATFGKTKVVEEDDEQEYKSLRKEASETKKKRTAKTEVPPTRKK